jgi:hypothetical protein
MTFGIWPGIICVSSVILGAQNIRGPAGLIDYIERLSNVLFLMHAIHRRHTGGDVIGDMAMVHPLAGIVSQHVARFHACRQKFGDIGVCAIDFHEFAVPMRRMQINFVAHADKVPTDPIAFVHIQARQVGEDIAVNRMFEMGFFLIISHARL